MYSRLQKINSALNSENHDTKNVDQYKYDRLYHWSKSNGAIFEHNFVFPVSYGPFGYIGVKAKKDIDQNEAVVFIPRKQLIISSDYKERFKFLYKDNEDEDVSNLILTLVLITEARKGKNSFYYDYISLLPKVDFAIFWNSNSISELDDEGIKDSIIFHCYEIQQNYDLVKSEKEFQDLSKSEFIFYFSHVQSRQFYLDDNTSLLVPLAELLNHNTVKTRYEFFDSENLVYKFTLELCGESKNDIQPTKSTVFPKKFKSTDPYQEIIIKNNSKFIEISENDFFVFATSTGQKFKKGEQIFLNYSKLTNKASLMHYGFNMILNKYDSTVFYFEFKKGEKEIDNYLKISFPKKYKEDLGKLKIKVKFRAVCGVLIKYFRFMHFYSRGKIDEYYLYKFERELEIEFIEKSIEEVERRLKPLAALHDMEGDLQYLEKGLEEGNLESQKTNIVIYRTRRKINLMHQIELLTAMKDLLKKHKVEKYYELSEFVDEIPKGCSKFEKDEKCIYKVLKYISLQKI